MKRINTKRNIGVIIRTQNESRWIGFCLSILLKQKNIDRLSIVLVDCNSSDFTIEKAKSVFPKLIVKKYLGDYFPGKAINIGAKQLKNVNYLVVLSAHCIPLGECWLSNLIKPLETNDKVAASYCRQIPTPASSSENKRDLLNTFLSESRTQKKDSFFHNAASILRFKCWNENNFDPSLKHIEDRYWAKNIIKKGWQIYYNASCSVVHEHGLNQHEIGYKSFRGEGVSSLLYDDNLTSSWLTFAKKETKVLILIVASKLPKEQLIKRLELGHCQFSKIIIPKLGSVIKEHSSLLIERDANWDDISVYNLVREVLLKKISSNEFFDYVYFLDGDKLNSMTKIPEKYVVQSYLSGAEMCLQVKSYKEDFFMLEPNEISWRPLSQKLMDKYDTKPHFKKALYGRGTLLRTDNLLKMKVPRVIYFDE